jgi:competence protein ComEA
MRRMKGAWIVFCLIALPRLFGTVLESPDALQFFRESATSRQIVPGTHEFPAQNASPAGKTPPPSFLQDPFVFFSTAPAESLVLLPGLGPVLAARICNSRGGKRSFNSWDDLRQIRGVGPKTVSRLRRLVESQ